MSGNFYSQWSPRIVCIALIAACPLASAAAPITGADGNGIGPLLLGPTQLSTRELSTIRGGFDLSPNMSISFAFSQVDSLGGTIIQSIMVPKTTLTQNSSPVTVNITGGGNTNLIQQSSTGNTEMPIGNATVPLNITTPTQAGASSITVTSTVNNGQTVVLSQLASSGITNVIQNQANNSQMISQMTTMNIDISGMSQWLSQQQASFTLSNEMLGSQRQFH